MGALGMSSVRSGRARPSLATLAVALAFVLVMPSVIVAERDEWTFEFADPVGDVGPGMGSNPDAPAYADLAALRVELSGDELTLALDLAGDVPEPGSEPWEELSYSVAIGRSVDDPDPMSVWLTREGGAWAADAWAPGSGLEGPGLDDLSHASVSISVEQFDILGSSLVVVVRSSGLGSPDELRFSATATALGEPRHADGSDVTVDPKSQVWPGDTEWSYSVDVMPDGYDQWLTLEGETMEWAPPQPESPWDPDCFIDEPKPVRVRTGFGELSISDVEVGACSWHIVTDAQPLTEFLLGLGRGFEDFRLVQAAYVEAFDEGGWNADMTAAILPGIPGSLLRRPFLEAVSPYLLLDPSSEWDEVEIAGRAVTLVRFPEWETCAVISVSDQAVALGWLAECDGAAIDAVTGIQGAVIDHLEGDLDILASYSQTLDSFDGAVAEIAALFEADHEPADLRDVGDGVLGYLVDHPDTSPLISGRATGWQPQGPYVERVDPEVLASVEDALAGCERNLEKGRWAARCVEVFGPMARIYLASGDEAMLELITKFIAATVPAYEGDRRTNYLGLLIDSLTDSSATVERRGLGE